MSLMNDWWIDMQYGKNNFYNFYYYTMTNKKRENNITLWDALRHQQQQSLENAKELINYTGHVIHIIDEDDKISYTIPYQWNILCPEKKEEVGTYRLSMGWLCSRYWKRHDIKIVEPLLAKPKLPEEKEGVVYVVHRPVAEWAAQEKRSDFLYPWKINRVDHNWRIVIGSRELCVIV